MQRTPVCTTIRTVRVVYLHHVHDVHLVTKACAAQALEAHKSALCIWMWGEHVWWILAPGQV